MFPIDSTLPLTLPLFLLFLMLNTCFAKTSLVCLYHFSARRSFAWVTIVHQTTASTSFSALISLECSPNPTPLFFLHVALLSFALKAIIYLHPAKIFTRHPTSPLPPLAPGCCPHRIQNTDAGLQSLERYGTSIPPKPD